MDDAALIEKLGNTTNLEAILQECRAVAHELGFPHFLYGARLPVPLTRPYQLILSGYPPAWRARYDEQHYMLIDPVLKNSMLGLLPLDWDRIDKSDPRVLQFFNEAAEFGLRHGLTLPVHGAHGEFSLLSLSGQEPLPTSAAARSDLFRRAQWLATHIHEAMRRVVLQAPVEHARGELPARLTPRERECLRRAASGGTAADIADALNISERTVVYYFERCQQKLGVRGRQHAIARALTLGEIELDCYPSRLVQSKLLERRHHSALE